MSGARVAITGVGLCCPIGNSLDEVSSALQHMRHGIAVMQDWARIGQLATRLGAPVHGVERSAFPRAVIERLTTIKLVAQTGSHRHHIDFAACTEHGIAVAAPDRVGAGITTAELTWALILASLRNIPHEVEQLKKGAWQTSLGTGLRNLTLGIYGLGGIGTLVAQVGRTFGMRIKIGRAHV